MSGSVSYSIAPSLANSPISGSKPSTSSSAKAAGLSACFPIIAAATNTEGHRKIIGLGVGPSEAEIFWMDFLRSLKARGLDGVKLVISAAHSGLRARSPGSSRQPGSGAASTGGATP